jgi:pimeloyl-ACP methyl ester carboxylesterase
MNRQFTVAALLAIASCVTSGIDDEAEKGITITDTSSPPAKQLPGTPAAGVETYKHDNNSESVEWFVCKGKDAPKATVVVHHSDNAGFSAQTFCSTWSTQVFLGKKVDVIGINRPGYGKSTGEPDLAGPQSLAAVTAAMNKLDATKTLRAPVVGYWGYGAGATMALISSKNKPDIKFIIAGGGVYDLEDARSSSQDAGIKAAVESIAAKDGEAGLEFRSVAWDPSGLPERIVLYHAKGDSVIPPAQAEAFRDSLASAKYKVTLQVIDGITHEIPEVHHQKILGVLAESVF